MSTKKGANPAPEFKWYIADKPVNGNINNTKEEVEDGKINFISIFEYIGGAIKELWNHILKQFCSRHHSRQWTSSRSHKLCNDRKTSPAGIKHKIFLCLCVAQ